MIASLGMYDRDETALANDAFWALIRENLGYGPKSLDRTTPDSEIWQNPDLVLSQTCGMPYRMGLHEHVQLVGTPDYGIDDAMPGYYYSVFVVRKNDHSNVRKYRNRIFAYNEPTSQSGWAAAQNHVRELGFRFENLFCSGGHLDSARAVAKGRADIATLDAVTWRMICDYDALASDLKVIQTTPPTPGLPFITAPNSNSEAIFVAVERAAAGLDPNYQKKLGIKGIVRIPAVDYMKVPTPAAP